MEIAVAHSPDADDYFMFWAIREKLIEFNHYEFRFATYDTETLNHRAREAADQIIAISVANYPNVKEDYLVMSSGASIGRGYGPVVVSKENYNISELNSLKIGIPGFSTTAAKILRLIAPNAELLEISISPYEQIFSALDAGIIDAALLIHEGQVSYQERDLKCMLDIGKWWQENKGLPLPLGINVISNKLDREVKEEVSSIVQSSIRFALDNKKDAISYLTQLINKDVLDTPPLILDRYLSMYANEDTYQMDQDCLKALELLI